MALGLGDIQKHGQKSREAGLELKQRVLRPWETFDQRGLQTRTNQAQAAVKRAKEIVARNNAMVEELRTGVVDEQKLREMEEFEALRLRRFDEEETEFIVAPIQVQKGKGIFSLIRDVFGH